MSDETKAPEIAAPKKQKKSAGSTAAKKKKPTPAERAAKIRAEAELRRDRKPGDVIGGEPGWHYYAAPPDEPGRTRTEARLADLGYEPAPGVRMVGVHRGMVWRVPMEIAQELNAAKTKRLDVAKPPRRGRR